MARGHPAARARRLLDRRARSILLNPGSPFGAAARSNHRTSDPTVMQTSALARLFHYRVFLAIALVAVTTAILYAARPVLSPALVPLLYLLPVGLSAGLWGLTAGMVAAFAAFMGFNYFFIEPRFTLSVHQISDLTVLLVFLFVALVISQLMGMAQSGLAAARARAGKRKRKATTKAKWRRSSAGRHFRNSPPPASKCGWTTRRMG
jgi:two-component system sensor histidine kinase KdpD